MEGSVFSGLDSSVPAAGLASALLHPINSPSLRRDPHSVSPPISRSASPGTLSCLVVGSPGRQPSRPASTLPVLPKYSGAWDSLSSSPENRKAESAYFTAAWGSPYATPSPRRPSWSASQWPSLDWGSIDNSPASMPGDRYLSSGANNLDHWEYASAPGQLPRRFCNSLGRSSRRDSLSRHGGLSSKEFTEDWINRYLLSQPKSERANWLSDDSSSEAPSFITARNHFADDPSDGWLGLGDDRGNENLLKTPTLSNFVSRRPGAGNIEGRALGRLRPKHGSQQSTDTLKQEDFWGFEYDQEQGSSSMLENNELRLSPIGVSLSGVVSPIEKLPLPPLLPTETDSGLVSVQKSDTPEAPSPKSVKREALDNNPAQRSKVRVVWNSKACIISVPPEDKRGSVEATYRLLTRTEIEQGLRRWIDAGYDVSGFDISTPEDSSVPDKNGGLSRPSYPDPVEYRQEWEAGNYSIRFPNQSEWDAYVAYLKEEKLRALGVSLGGDEPQPAISPSSLAISHIAQLPGLVASPPVPSASAASNPLVLPRTFSPHFNQTTSTVSGTGSVVSQASQFVNQQPFLTMDQNLPATLPYQFQPTPPTHTPQSFFNVRQAGVPVAVPGNLSRLGSVVSPVSPLNADDLGQFHAGTSQLPAPRRDSIRVPSHLDSTDLLQQSKRSRSTTLWSEKTVERERFQSSNVEIAQPTPRGHSHNLSETLQKGLDRYAQADGHLEESIQRQLEEHDREPGSDLMSSRWAIREPNQGHSQYQQHDSFSQSHVRLFGEREPEEQIHDSAEIDTNPSLAGSPHDQEPDIGNHPWHNAKASASSYVPVHRAEASTSSLNVEAKVFDPMGSFASNNFSFQTTSFQPPGFDSPSTVFSPTSSVFKPTSSSATALSVAAPVFTPFTNQETFFSPKVFTFSSPLNVDAPVFSPGPALNPGSKSEAGPASIKSRIFGDIDFAQVSQPVKKSKAIPIVRPDDNEGENRENGDEEAEVEPGAPSAQPRQKRARRGNESSDREVELSAPSYPLAETAQAQSPQATSQFYKPAEGKENEAPEDDVRSNTTDSASVLINKDSLDHFEGFGVTRNSISGPLENCKEGEPVVSESMTVGVQEQVSPPNADIPKVANEDKDELTVTTLDPETAPSDTAQDPIPGEMKKSAMLATTKSFVEFIPVDSAASDPAPKEVIEQPPLSKPTGLLASRYATINPPASPQINEVPEPVEPVTQVETMVLPPNESSEHETTPPSDDAEHDSPDEQELNAVMEQLNGDDPDVGVERSSTPALAAESPESSEPSESLASPKRERVPIEALPVNIIRSEAPSPSLRQVPELASQNVRKLGSDFDDQSPMTLSQRGIISGTLSPVRQLISVDDRVSDWGDVFSSGEDEKLILRSKFFDRHVNDIVGNVLEERLGPLEEALNVIQDSVASLASRSASGRPLRGTSTEIEHSDADDEDEDDPYRARSPLNVRDRKIEKMKNAMLEALASYQVVQREHITPATLDWSPIQDAIAEMNALTSSQSAQEQTLKTAIQDTFSDMKVFENALRDGFSSMEVLISSQSVQDQIPDVKSIIQDVISRQLELGLLRSPDADEASVESLKLQIDGLKSMLRLADTRAEEEHHAHKDTRDALSEAQAQLKTAEEDAARYSQAAENAETSLRQLTEEKIPHFEQVQIQSEALSKQQAALELTLSELSEKNISLEGILDEYRESNDHWKCEVAEVKTENQDLRSNLSHLKVRIADSMHARESLRSRFDRLQDDMITATRDIAGEQAAWRKREQELHIKLDTLSTAYDREAKLCEKLEIHVGELEQQEREAAKLKFIFGQSEQENARLEGLVVTLRREIHECQSKAARFEREFNEARESSHTEVQRTRASMEADVEAANNQVNLVRVELEAQISRLQHQLESNRMDADTARERYELLLEEAKDARTNAMIEMTASKQNVIEEQRKLHERVLNDLRERHARALHNASEDRARTESHLAERLQLANDKIQHLQDRVSHSEEKLEIAKSAARAAAQAAQTAKGASVALPPSHPTSPSMAFRKDSLVPERISPQALRESILVLQDQLQQREATIEELEQELSSVDKDAPNKIKDRDTEISWLRELLGVRIDELQDIINTLSQPFLDKNAVRDAAIRLRANLQMEQQEKERAMAGGKAFTPLAALSSIASSPRSLPLAAAAAWGNWRKARDSIVPENAAGSYQETPSKPTNVGGLLSGLLTPPGSNVRQSPNNVNTSMTASTSGRGSYSENRPLRAYNNPPRSLSTRQVEALPEQHEPPTTPPLLRRSSYDHDAEPNSYAAGHLIDDGESTITGPFVESPKGSRDSLFGPRLV